jgi:hypothetical protein
MNSPCVRCVHQAKEQSVPDGPVPRSAKQRRSGAKANVDHTERRVIAIGGSAGAIGAVKALCDALQPDIPAAICIVIHVGARGRNLIAGALGERCPIPVGTAVDGQSLINGRAYVAAADHCGRYDPPRAWTPREPRASSDRSTIEFGRHELWLSRHWRCSNRHAERWRGGARRSQALRRSDRCAKPHRGRGARHDASRHPPGENATLPIGRDPRPGIALPKTSAKRVDA